MKNEQQIRDWAISLRKEWDEHSDIPSMAIGIRASLDTVRWILGDTPASDLVRVKAAMSTDRDEITAELWLTEPHSGLRELSPLQCVAIGRADEVIALIASELESAGSVEPAL